MDDECRNGHDNMRVRGGEDKEYHGADKER